MITSGSRPCLSAIGAKVQSLVRLKWFFGLIVAVMFTVAATPLPDEDNPDAQYVHIMTLIDRADALRTSGKADAAKAKYKEAQIALTDFKRNNPLWNPKTVNYRLTEVTDRIEIKPPVTEMTAPAKPAMKLESESAKDTSKSLVKLLDAGLEPRKPLRLHVKAGDKQAVVVTLKINMDMGASPAAAMIPKMPPATIPADVTVEKVAANGDISYQFVLGEGALADDPNTMPQIAQGAKAAFKTIKGLTVSGVMSSRGATKSVVVKAPPGADPKMTEALTKFKDNISNNGSPMFPEEAVGAGAKWEITAPPNPQGVTADLTVQLVSFEGDHLTATLAATGNGGDQKDADAASGTPSSLPQMNINATGNVTSDLSKLFPSQATMDLHVDTKIPAGGQQPPMAMKADLNLGIEAK